MPQSDLPEVPDTPLETSYKPISFPRIPQELIASIALGVEDELVVAARHGLSVEQYQLLAQLPPFQRAVAAQRAEFEKSGLTFQVMSAMQAAEVRDRVFTMAMSNDSTFPQALEALKTLAKLGNLEPKETKAASTPGVGFSININLGNRSVMLDASPQPAPLAASVGPLELDS